METTVGVLTNQGNIDLYSKTLEQCLKSTSGLTGTTYQNICDGTHYFVANGFWDYALGFVLLGIGIAFILMLMRMIFD